MAFAGALVLGGGCAYAAPVGRNHLVEVHELDVDLEELTRGEIVTELGLTMINRVAVVPELKGFGIGSALAKVARRYAPRLFPGAQFVEVMTTRRIRDARAITAGTYLKETSCKSQDSQLLLQYPAKGVAGRANRDAILLCPSFGISGSSSLSHLNLSDGLKVVKSFGN